MSQLIIDQVLRSHRVSLTRPRKQLYEVLSHSEPLTMQELISALPELDKTTVYRSVALFEQLGIAQRLQIGFKYKIELSNAYQEHHHHIACLRCGTIVALPEDDSLEKRLLALAQAAGFSPTDHQIEVRGLCHNCQQETT